LSANDSAVQYNADISQFLDRRC